MPISESDNKTNSAASLKSVETMEDYSLLAGRFSEAQQAIALVTTELNDRISGKDNNKTLNSAKNDKLVGFIDHFYKDYLVKDIPLWEQAVTKGIGDKQTNMIILESLYSEIDMLKGFKQEIYDAGYRPDDGKMNKDGYLDQYMSKDDQPSLNDKSNNNQLLPPQNNGGKDRQNKNNQEANDYDLSQESYGNDFNPQEYPSLKNYGADFSNNFGISSMFD